MLPADYTRARRVLARRDPVIAALMRAHGACGLARAQHTDPFHALVQAIISQQLSTAAARTIGKRLRDLYDGGMTAAAIAATPDPQLRVGGVEPAEGRLHAGPLRQGRVAGSWRSAAWTRCPTTP